MFILAQENPSAVSMDRNTTTASPFLRSSIAADAILITTKLTTSPHYYSQVVMCGWAVRRHEWQPGFAFPGQPRLVLTLVARGQRQSNSNAGPGSIRASHCFHFTAKLVGIGVIFGQAVASCHLDSCKWSLCGARAEWRVSFQGGRRRRQWKERTP